MKFKIKPPKYQIGDTRIKKKFALFPIRIDDEVRWLEFVTIEQKLIGVWGGFEDPCIETWTNMKFIDSAV